MVFALRPCQWAKYCATNDFKYPCCLCAAQRPGAAYTETNVEQANTGKNPGKWFAVCVDNRCGYKSE